MTPEHIAQHLDAKRAGANRWMAKCPAHQDRLPSLSIGVGAGGRALLNCHAGCTLDAVLKASGIAHRDLFAGPPPTPRQLAALEQERQVAAAKRKLKRKAERLEIDKLRALRATVNDLGGKLMRSPADDALAWLFDSTLWALHAAEAAAETRGLVI